MKRFVGLSLVLFFAGLALVLYAVFFGPNDFRASTQDHRVPVGEVQYSKIPGSPQAPSVQSGTTLPSAGQPDANELNQEQKPANR